MVAAICPEQQVTGNGPQTHYRAVSSACARGPVWQTVTGREFFLDVWNRGGRTMVVLVSVSVGKYVSQVIRHEAGQFSVRDAGDFAGDSRVARREPRPLDHLRHWLSFLLWGMLLMGGVATEGWTQLPPFEIGNQPAGPNPIFGGPNQGDNNMAPGADAANSQGGGTQADFDSLIELIQSTIAPDSWDGVGGVGSISGFEGGVYVDATGLLRQVPPNVSNQLQALRNAAARTSVRTADRVAAGQPSKLRKVSLNRLEEAVQQLATEGKRPTDIMRHLAGLTAVTSIHCLHDSGEIVLAGPAGDWKPGPHGQAVNTGTGQPTLVLDDLVVLLRNAIDEQGRFGCSITPRTDNLARTQEFLTASASQPLKPGQRPAWLREIRRRMGRQDIQVYGLPINSGAARALVEADYHMKLIGMGLADGVEGVVSYLDTVEPDANGQIPAMSVLRWWFTLHYQNMVTSEDRDVFQWSGGAVQVLSENELLAQNGQRIHTGGSDDLNRQFAASFTEHFSELCDKYPCYARLRNLFDLALATTLIQAEDWPGQIGWSLPFFGSRPAVGARGDLADRGTSVYQTLVANVPCEVETVLNHRVICRKHVIAGVSGGVQVQAANAAAKLVRGARSDAGLCRVPTENGADAPVSWWWD